MRNFANVKRIVIKIGTNILSKSDGIDSGFIRQVARQIAALQKDGKEILIVSSGAIGLGAGALKINQRISSVKTRQACAAIGQPLLMAEYRKALARYKIETAQVLLTAEVLNNRKTFVNLKNAIETLLKLGVVPIINENDSVSTEEIGTAFGDNDRLAAYSASKIDAELLIILSDIDCLYDKDPRKNKDAKPISEVFEITDTIIRSAGKSGSKHSTGGMKTKIEAAIIAANAGSRIVLANGREKNIISRILAGENVGTVFMPKRKLSSRKRWILNTTAAGTIRIDDGAAEAIKNRKSLLPMGIVNVEGKFKAGDVVMINDIAKAVAGLDSADIKRLAGRHSSEIKQILGHSRKSFVVNADDIVLIDY